MIYTMAPTIRALKEAFQAIKQDMASLHQWIFQVRDSHIELKHRVDKIENKLAEMERERLLR